MKDETKGKVDSFGREEGLPDLPEVHLRRAAWETERRVVYSCILRLGWYTACWADKGKITRPSASRWVYRWSRSVLDFSADRASIGFETPESVMPRAGEQLVSGDLSPEPARA